MALNTKHTYANRLFAHLTAAVSASATSLSFYPEEITNLLRGWSASTWLYLCIMDASGNLEIVKMTALSNSILTVERGQGGTTARAWALGSLIASRPVAEYYNRYLQKGVFRSGAYNPNQVLTGEFTGEKFYQTGPVAAQRRWWINTTGTRWRLLTGEPYTGEIEYDDGFWSFMPNWVNVSDPSYWDVTTMATWDAVNERWYHNNNAGLMSPAGTWHVGKRWTDIYIEVLEGYFTGILVRDSSTATLDVSNWGPPTEAGEEVRTLTWGALDFGSIKSQYVAGSAYFKIYVNDGAAYDADWQTEDVTDSAYWTPTYGTWDGSAWTFEWVGGDHWEIRLVPTGGWEVGHLFSRFRTTGVLEGGVNLDQTTFYDAGETKAIATQTGDDNPQEGYRKDTDDFGLFVCKVQGLGIETHKLTAIELLTEDIYS